MLWFFHKVARPCRPIIVRVTPICIKLYFAGHFAGVCSLGTLRRRTLLLDSAADEFLLPRSGSAGSYFFGAAVARSLGRGIVGGGGGTGGLAAWGVSVTDAGVEIVFEALSIHFDCTEAASDGVVGRPCDGLIEFMPIYIVIIFHRSRVSLTQESKYHMCSPPPVGISKPLEMSG